MNSLYLKYNNRPSVDTSKLDQLVTLGKDIDEDVLGQLLSVHEESTNVILDEIESFFKKSEYAEIKRCAHKLKSSCANLGLMRFHYLCADFENILAQGLPSNQIDRSVVQEFIESIRYEKDQTTQKLFSYRQVAA